MVKKYILYKCPLKHLQILQWFKFLAITDWEYMKNTLALTHNLLNIKCIINVVYISHYDILTIYRPVNFESKSGLMLEVYKF